jgi:CRISPR system Cascade subunit CasE
MIAAALHLSRSDCKALRITDPYSIHRVVYSLFDDIRSDSEKQASTPSGILYADKGGDFHARKILILANRQPAPPEHGELHTRPIPDNFLDHSHYNFEVLINPTRRDSATGRIVPIKGAEAILDWFADRADHSWGFVVNPKQLEILGLGVQHFAKGTHQVTHAYAGIKGQLQVSDRQQFNHSFCHGIGRGRAFGSGLLQIVPRTHPLTL